MAEWLRPELWEVLTIKLRGIKPGQILITKEAHRGGMVLKFRPLVAVAGNDPIFGGQDGQVVEAGALGGTHD
jgi:hypothetical protein